MCTKSNSKVHQHLPNSVPTVNKKQQLTFSQPTSTGTKAQERIRSAYDGKDVVADHLHRHREAAPFRVAWCSQRHISLLSLCCHHHVFFFVLVFCCWKFGRSPQRLGNAQLVRPDIPQIANKIRGLFE
jgi:hypothetical protein